MSIEIKSMPPSSRVSLRREWLASPLVFLASLLLFLMVYLYYNWPEKWMSTAGILRWDGATLTLSKGQGHPTQGKLLIHRLTDQGIAIAALTPPVFQADDYATVNWSVSGIRPGMEMEFMWRTAENRVFVRPLVWEDNVIQPLRMTEDENWHGQITDLAIIFKGMTDAPISVNNVSLDPLSLSGTLRELAGNWFAFSKWQQTSINFVDMDSYGKKFTPTFAALVITLVAMAIYIILCVTKKNPLNASIIWGIILLGWLLLDVRWQLNLFHQLGITSNEYAGKSWEEKHLAAEDQGLFDFTRQIKSKLPPAATRILLFSDVDYIRGRGAYHLYPHNVLARRDFPDASRFHSGDYIALFLKQRVKYDPAKKLLTWGDGQSLKADMLLFSNGNALFRVN